MEPKNIINSGDPVEKIGKTEFLTDQLLREMGELYRERFQAMQSNDRIMLGMISHQINGLRERLEKL